jgi:hypothetical protein
LDQLKERGYDATDGSAGYSYLLDTPASCFTIDGVEKLQAEKERTAEQLSSSRAAAARVARAKIKAEIDALETVRDTTAPCH